MKRDPDLNDNIIDAGHLESYIHEMEDEIENGDREPDDEEYVDLKKLHDGLSPYGDEFIADSYMKEYMMQYISDIIGELSKEWPYTCID